MQCRSLLLLAFALLLLACNKDKHPAPASGGKKLTKIFLSGGLYTINVYFTYDAEGKWATLRQTQVGQGFNDEDGFRIIRKADGMIDKVIFKFSSNADSTTIAVTSANQQYSTIQWREAYGADSVTKNVDFLYDNQGKIAQGTTTDIVAGQPDPKERYDFAYQNNDLTSMKVYRISGGTNSLYQEYAWEYDQKINPLSVGNEWALMSFVFNTTLFASAHNFIKQTLKYPGSPNPDNIETLVYTYNEQNLPVSATLNDNTPGDPTVTLTYTYE